jgi:hypothetical protein
VKLYVHHDAKTLARLVGAEQPGCDGLFVGHGAHAGTVLAAFADGNPLADDWMLDLELPGSSVVCWSGTLADTLFGDDPATWMRSGHDAFRAFCDAAAPTLVARGRRLAFRPHARHVLSDVQGCLNLVRERAGQPFGLAVGPGDLLLRSMLGDIEDHLVRSITTLAPRAAMFLLHDVRPAEDRDDDLLVPVPLGSGVLPRDLVRSLLAEHAPPDLPVVLLPQELDRQREWLGR